MAISLVLITLLTPLFKKSFAPEQVSAATPVITSITPNRGLIAGGNTVTIDGNYLDSFSWKQTTADLTADHVCAITAYNTIYCWGRGDVGQIGNGNTANQSIPTAVSQGAIAAGVTAKWLSVGGASNGSSCMVGSNNRVYCWGGGANGKLGNGASSNSSTPVLVSQGAVPAGAVLSQVSVGENHACALSSTDNWVYCWGLNSSGQLGNGSTATATTPVRVAQGAIPVGTQLTQVTTGHSHTCALGSNGKAYCWGSVIGGSFSSLSPQQLAQGAVPAASTITQISSGMHHVCVLASNNWAYCFGYGLSGRLGNGGVSDQATLAAVSRGVIPAGINLTRISAGGSNACVIGTDNKAYCWGYGAVGSNGNNSSADQNTPVAVLPGVIPATASISSIMVGTGHVLAVGNDSQFYGWGHGLYGRLGTGNESSAFTPVGARSPVTPTLTFGGVAATSITVVGVNRVTAVVPARATAGAVNVVLANYDSSTTLTNGYTYYTIPSAPTIATTPGNKQVTVSWSAPANGSSVITGYSVEYKLNTNTTWTTLADITTTSRVVTGLANGTAYNFRIRARNAAGLSAYSNTATTTTWDVPSTPTTPTATPGNAQVALSWTAPANNGSAITDYLIQYATTSTGPWTTFADGTSTATTTTVTGLTNGTTYYFRVAAVNAVGTGGYSANATAIPRTIPSTPTNLTATPGLDSVILNWTAPSNNGGSPITDYRIEYCTATSAGVCTGAWTTYNDGISTNTTTTVSGLGSSATAYYNFRVSAINLAGTSTPSSAVTAQASYITLVVSSDIVSLSITPDTGNKFSSSSHTVTVKTNNPAGYDLSLSAQASHSNLINTANATQIITPTSGTYSNPLLDMPINSWGYRLNNTTFGTTTTLETNTSTSQYSWAKVQSTTTPDIISTGSGPTAGITIPVYYGAKVNAAQSSGTYQTVVRYTGVAKP